MASVINTVTGNWVNGNTITINGTGFGSKAVAKPIIWCPFDAGTLTEKTVLSRVSLGSQWMAIDSADPPAGRTYYAKSTAIITNAGTLFADFYSALGIHSQHVYCHVRRKLVPSTFFGSCTNIKFWRHHTNDAGSGLCDFINSINNPASQMNWDYEGSAEGLYTYNNTVYYPTNAWFQLELECDWGTLNTANAGFKEWVNGVLVGNAFNHTAKTGTYPNDCGSLLVDSQQTSGLDPNAVVYNADFYGDVTWQRVSLGNASTYNACTRRTPLPPTAWSNTQIQCVVDMAGITGTAWIYVCDSTGAAGVNTNGFSTASISGGSVPAAPTNLRVTG